MNVPEGGPERFFVLTDRAVNGPPTMVFFETSKDAIVFARETDRREGAPSHSTVHSIVDLRSRATLRAKREAEWAGITFRPCPYCGKALTCHDVGFMDEDGGTVDDVNADRELFVHIIDIGCGCGGGKAVYAEAIRWPKAGWRKRFADRINTRAEAVQ